MSEDNEVGPLDDDGFIDWLGRNGFEVIEDQSGQLHASVIDVQGLYLSWLDSQRTCHGYMADLAFVKKAPFKYRLTTEPGEAEVVRHPSWYEG